MQRLTGPILFLICSTQEDPCSKRSAILKNFLFPELFAVHNSHIINLFQCRNVRGEGGYVIMSNDVTVRFSRTGKRSSSPDRMLNLCRDNLRILFTDAVNNPDFPLSGNRYCKPAIRTYFLLLWYIFVYRETGINHDQGVHYRRWSPVQGDPQWPSGRPFPGYR